MSKTKKIRRLQSQLDRKQSRPCMLILAPIPEVRKWPWYGHALELAEHQWPVATRGTGDHKAIHAEVLSALAEARRVTATLEGDRQNLENHFPELRGAS